MLCCKHKVCYSIASIWPCCECFYLVYFFSFFVNNIKFECCPITFSYPVFLHYLYSFRPFQFWYILKEFFCIFCCFYEPLLKEFFFYFCFSVPPAFSVVNLLVRKDCFAFRAPVYRCFFPVHQAFFHEFKEEILVPFVVFWLACGYHPAPVIAQPERFLLHDEVCYCFLREFLRHGFCLYCRIFCWQPERVIPHWV